MILSITCSILCILWSGVSSFSSSPSYDLRYYGHAGAATVRRIPATMPPPASSSSPSSTTIYMVNNPFERISNAFTKTSDSTFSQEKNNNNNNNNNNVFPTSSSSPPLTPRPPTPPPGPAMPSSSSSPTSGSTTTTATNTPTNKFDFVQRIESVKCAVIGALSGSLAVFPVALLHYAATSLPQWELTTDMAAVQGALFAIVYRYAIRNDDNPMLNQGVLGAFVLVRTLPTIQASPECSAIPLSCGAPIGYFNWSMLSQAVVQGVESAVLFGGVYVALEYAFSKGWISKFE